VVITFWKRFAALNGRFIIKEIEALFPGSPAVATPVYFLSGGIFMADVTVKDDAGTLSASVTFLDDEGNPTTADDVPVWASSDETIATVSAAADGLSAVVTVVGALGAAVISVDSTNAAGTDVHAQGTVTVVASDEVSGEVTFS
jgi:hypothetical protein